MGTPDGPTNDASALRDEGLEESFAAFAANAAARAPLYLALGRIIAEDPTLRGLLDVAPPAQRRPVMLLAALHHAVLAAPDSRLGDWYPTVRGTDALDPAQHDPAYALRQFCRDHAQELVADISTRSVQTNEVGRCAPLLIALARLERECRLPLGLIDCGTSAGLTLCLDRYHYRFQPGGTLGPKDPETVFVEIACGTRHDPPIPGHMPEIGLRIGIDTDPADDEGSKQWLQACVWADELDRFRRLEAALQLAATVPRAIIKGDYVDLLPEVIASLPDGVHPTIVTSWSLCYLAIEQQERFSSILDEVGRSQDLTWVAFESPREVPIMNLASDALTWLAVRRYRSGRASSEALARAHPHGHWLQWAEA